MMHEMWNRATEAAAAAQHSALVDLEADHYRDASMDPPPSHPQHYPHCPPHAHNMEPPGWARAIPFWARPRRRGSKTASAGHALTLGLLSLFALSSIVTFGYQTVLRDFTAPQSVNEPRWFEVVNPMDERRRLDIEQYMETRILEVFKETWPECVSQSMYAWQCKDFIDEEILSTFTERDKLIRVIIKDKRKNGDEWYNTVVITLDDQDMARGIEDDGLIEYDFVWESSGVEATPEQEAEIPPILATETEAGSPITIEAQTTLLAEPEVAALVEASLDPEANPEVTTETVVAEVPDYVPEANPEEEVYEPLVLEEEPILVEGASVEGAIIGEDTNPIAGGVVVDPDAPNTAEGDVKLAAAIEEYNAPPTLSPVAAAAPAGTTEAPVGTGAGAEGGAGGEGELAGSGSGQWVTRELEPFDCDGLTGYNCCLMIKMKVPDSDENGRAIQCQLVYQEGSNKEQWWLNSRGKKVFVFANHNDIVNKIPKIVGKWPKAKKGEDFSEWLADGGTPPSGQ